MYAGQVIPGYGGGKDDAPGDSFRFRFKKERTLVLVTVLVSVRGWPRSVSMCSAQPRMLANWPQKSIGINQ